MGKDTAVTSFFRDPEALACLEQKVIGPMLTAHGEAARPIRIWIPGCSTGEEAYSVAMLLHEHASRGRKRVDFQIFATDADQVALDKGRAGRYPASIAADIGPDRLQKYFTRDDDGLTVQVGPQLRDAVVFAVQSIVKDPPYSKLDLISCPNLMTHFGSEQQQRLLPILHYALNPGGYLFLGTSATLGSSKHLFSTLDPEWNIFQRQELRTSKEELQSTNEELIALNTELQNKINDLVKASNDIKNLLDNAQIGIIFLDTALRIRRFTPTATDIVALNAGDIGRPLAQCVHRLRYDRLLEDTREVLETRRSKEMEIQTLHARWYLTRILPYRTIDDEVDGVVLTFTNVTPLKESNEKLEFLFNVLPVGISVVGRNRRPFKHNAALLEMCDLTNEEIAKLAHLKRKYIRPDGSERKTEEFAATRVIAGEPAVLNVESGFTRRDGRRTWLDASAVACPFADWGAIVVTSDITARKEAEVALHTSEEKFSKAFHLAPLMLAITDASTGVIIECNQQFLEMSGYSREEVIGKTKVEIGWLSPEVRARFMEVMATQGFVRNEEFVCRSKDGREHTCLYNGFIIDVRGQKQVVSMAHDISERQHREEAIKSTLRQEKETVLRELAHRTKNNMFVIRSMLNLHAMHTQNEEVQRLFTDVEDKIIAMALVHQKLYQSKNLSRLDLGEYLRELVAALAESHSLEPTRISANIHAESISALIDTAIPCGLVVTELVSNAFKHAFPDARTGSISIRLHRKHPNTIYLEVSDDGVGVPASFDFRQRSTLGVETIFMIVEHQLKGTVHFPPSPRGCICMIEFVDTLYSERV